MIRIPHDGLAEWAVEITDECLKGASDRRGRYEIARSLFSAGAVPGGVSTQNIVKPAIEQLAGMLFSPQRMSFLIEYAAPVSVQDDGAAALASRVLTASFLACHGEMAFSAAVRQALICGCGILRVMPEGRSFDLVGVFPENFGVLRDDQPDLAKQEAMCMVSYPMLSEVREMLGKRHDADRVMAQVEDAAARRNAEPTTPVSGRPRIAIGTPDPIGATGSGTVAFGRPGPQIPVRVRDIDTIELRELWVSDADRGGAWTTIQIAMPDVIVLGDRTRGNAMLPPGLPNAPTGIQETVPFRVVRPYPSAGSFWGWSLASALAGHQDAVTEQRILIDRARRRKRRPVVGLSGFAGIDEEQYDAMLTRGKLLVADNPAAKAQELQSPELGPLYEALDAELSLVHQFVGLVSVLRGQGESGVRAQGHAETLVRMASPRLIDPATEVESSLADVASLAFHLMQIGDGRKYASSESGEFTLSMLPRGWHMTVDSHSASPVFSEDERLLVLDLAKMGIIAPEDVIRMLRLPGQDLLVQRVRERAAAAAKMREEELAAGKKPPESPKKK